MPAADDEWQLMILAVGAGVPSETLETSNA